MWVNAQNSSKFKVTLSLMFLANVDHFAALGFS